MKRESFIAPVGLDIPSVIFLIWPIVVVWPKGNPLIAVLLSWFPLQQYSELPSLGNMCSPGCVNALQPYVPLSCLTSHLVWRWLAAPALFPSLLSLFQQPPHSSNCLSIQALPSPTAVHVSCLLPLSAFSLFSLLSRCCMGEIKSQSCKQLEAIFSNGSYTETEFNRGRGDAFLSLKSQTVKTGHRMLVHFSTLIHLMVTIETDDQTGLVATIAVSVSKWDFFKNSFIGTICSVLCNVSLKRITSQLWKSQTTKNHIIQTCELNLPLFSKHTAQHPYLLLFSSFSITTFSAAA